MDIENIITSEISISTSTLQRLASISSGQIVCTSKLLLERLAAGSKLLIFGNGGSAADAQHFAAELVSRYRRERQALPAIALTTDTSLLTAISNDYAFNNVFNRQVQALAQPGDVLIGISTSGRSANVISGLMAARQSGAHTVALTGEYIDDIAPVADQIIAVPSTDTPRIQERSQRYHPYSL